MFIRGTGTFAVVGGTGRYRRATGGGEFNVVAEVLQFAPDGAWAAGAFQLTFTGEVSGTASDRLAFAGQFVSSMPLGLFLGGVREVKEMNPPGPR